MTLLLSNDVPCSSSSPALPPFCLPPWKHHLLSLRLPQQRTPSPPWRKRTAPTCRSATSLQASQAAPVHRFFATCAPGLEAVVAAELRSPMIGALAVEIGSAGVSFQGSSSTGLKANLWLRSAVRVLQELASGSISRSPVYDFVRNAADWPTLLTADSEDPDDDGAARNQFAFRTFDVQARVWDCSRVANANYASVRSKDAICDAIRDACHGQKPKSPKETAKIANVPLFLSLFRDRAILYRDMSGASLHKRGYRDVMHKASLNEGIAAAILIMAGWNRWIPGFGVCNKNKIWEGEGESGGPVLMDPMCGSGTILIEAALMASNSAPGLMRTTWPFMTWHDFNLQIWRDCQSQALDAKIEPPPGMRLLGNDIHEGALSLCVRDAKTAGVYDLFDLNCQDCRFYTPPISPSLVVVNPPWGSRLQDDSELIACTWTALGRFLKQSCTTSDLYVLSGNAKATRDLQLKADKKWQLTVGGVDCKLLHYYVLPPKQKVDNQEKIKGVSTFLLI